MESQKKYKNTEKGKETEIVYRLKNRSRIREYHKNWVKNNPDKVRVNKRNGLLKSRENGHGSIHYHTIKSHGKLISGFEYHHNTEPYTVDGFMILEKAIHLWYHKNIKRMVRNKQVFGIYNPSRNQIRRYSEDLLQLN